MTITYVCRHCTMPLGEVNTRAVSEDRLGFHLLTPDERKDIITYNHDGHITVNSICDYCQETLERYPELSLIGNPLQ